MHNRYIIGKLYNTCKKHCSNNIQIAVIIITLMASNFSCLLKLFSFTYFCLSLSDFFICSLLIVATVRHYRFVILIVLSTVRNGMALLLIIE